MTRLFKSAAGRGLTSSRYARLGQAPTGDLQNRRYTNHAGVVLPNGSTIRLVTPAGFLATKLAAFGDRGRRDPMASHDLEDLIFVIDGRREIVADFATAPPDRSHCL